MSRIRPLLLTIVACALATMPAHAISFKATLSAIKLNARPGQILNSAFRLTLDKDQKKSRFRAHAEDWWRSEDGKQSYYVEPGTLQRSCGNWVAINPVESEVEPGETLVIRLTISVSPDAQPGGYWCALTVDELPDPLEPQDNVAVNFLASVSTAIFVYVSPIDQAAEITSMVIGEHEATIGLQNAGNTPLTIEGKVEFRKDGQADPVAVLTLGRGMLFTQPITTGLYSAALPDASVLPSGSYLVRAIVDFGADHYIGVQRQIELVRGPAKVPPGTLVAGGAPR